MTSLNNITDQIVRTLPDSVTERKQLLRDVLEVVDALDRKNVRRGELFSMLNLLEAHEKSQLDFFKHISEEGKR
jgi:hypothetical protein